MIQQQGVSGGIDLPPETHFDTKRHELLRLRVLTGLSILWFCGYVAGVVGITAVTIPQYAIEKALYIVTCVFGGVILLGFTLIIVRPMYGCGVFSCKTTMLLLGSTPVLISIVALLWMDWTLGIVTGNLVGVPSQQAEVVYWTYVAVKRLGLLST